MKHFSQSILSSSISAVDVKSSFTDNEFIRCQLSLIIAMDANPDDMTASEERVIADFIKWFKDGKEFWSNDVDGKIDSPAFVYVNMNTGFSQVFILKYGREPLISPLLSAVARTILLSSN